MLGACASMVSGSRRMQLLAVVLVGMIVCQTSQDSATGVSSVAKEMSKEGNMVDEGEAGFSMMEKIVSEARQQAIKEEQERLEREEEMTGESGEGAPEEEAGDEAEFQASSAFKAQNSLEERKRQSAKILAIGKGVPIIAERLHDKVNLPNVVKPKFMVPRKFTIPKFVEVLRGKLPWGERALATTTIRLTVQGGKVMAAKDSIGELYDAEKDEDGFLYFTYADAWRSSQESSLRKNEMSMQEMEAFLESRQRLAPEELDLPSHEYIKSQFKHPRLRAISVQQPLADAILCGLKRVEGRINPMKLPKKGGIWLALQVGRSLDHFTNYQVMSEVRKLWPRCPETPVNRKRLGCIVGLIHIKECVPAHICHDPWIHVLPRANYYLIIDKALPLPLAIPHRHSFSMWTVTQEACDTIVNFIDGRRGRLLENPPIPPPQIWVEGYQQDVPKRGGRPKTVKETGMMKDGVVLGVGEEETVEGSRVSRDDEDELTEGMSRADLQVTDGMSKAALEEEEAWWRQGADVTEDEEEKNILQHDMHPLEREMIMGTKLERKWKILHPDDDAPEVRSKEQLEKDKKKERIFFMQDFGPDAAAAAYRRWVKETALTLREKYLQGHSMSSAEWHAKVEEQKILPTLHEVAPNTSFYDGFPDWNDEEMQDRIRWDELKELSEESFSESHASGPNEDAVYDTQYDNQTIQPAYMQESIIDQLGILPPDQVKKSVLEAMTPLTDDEAKIMIAGDNGTSVRYRYEDDQGTFRLRPGQRAEYELSSAEQEEGSLFVPKVGEHRPATLPTVKDAIKGMIGVPEAPFRKRERKKLDAPEAAGGESEGEHGDVLLEGVKPKLTMWQQRRADKKRIREMRREKKGKVPKHEEVAPPLVAAPLEADASEEDVN